MLQGTGSSVGKSMLCAALCRIFREDGLRVAPFKSQNMALNSFATKEGLEMGRAQVTQAQAAGVEPSVEMNPILLKPTSDKKSQVICLGKPIGNMGAVEYHNYKPNLRKLVKDTYDSLESKYDVVVIEGAGSPAEINLKDGDLVNMWMAEAADAPVLLVGDIDRGGVFASLYGTVMLLEPQERARIRGMIVCPGRTPTSRTRTASPSASPPSAARGRSPWPWCGSSTSPISPTFRLFRCTPG